HRLMGSPGVLAALELLQGEDFPVRVWEQELLAARVDDYEREWLDRLGLSGEIVWTPFERREGRVGMALRENVGWLRVGAPAPAGARSAAPLALRRRRAGARPGRLVHDPPHAAPHGVRRRDRARLLRGRPLGRAVRPRRRARRARRARASRRAARARQHGGPGEPLGTRLRPGSARRLAGHGAAPVAELARLPPRAANR